MYHRGSIDMNSEDLDIEFREAVNSINSHEQTVSCGHSIKTICLL